MEENQILGIIREALEESRLILIKGCDWLKVLDLKIVQNNYQSQVESFLGLQSYGDPLTKLIFEFLPLSELNHVRSFIRDQVGVICSSYWEKFWVYLENLKYTDKSHDRISLDLLYEMYEEGKRVGGGAFETQKSKYLSVKKHLKSETCKIFEEFFESDKPDE